MSDGQLDGADRPTRARRADRLTDEERRLQAARWQAMAEKMAGEEEGEEEGNEEDSEFDGFGDEEIGEEEEFVSEEDDLSAARKSLMSEERLEGPLAGEDENKEDDKKKKERELISNNLVDYPFFRGVYAEVNISACERVQYSYIKLPDTFKFGECSGRKDDPVAQTELNDIYVGVPPPQSSTKVAVLANPAKSMLLMVVDCDKGEDRLYEADMGLYQIKMALRYLSDYVTAQGETKQRIGAKFKKHAVSIDQFFKEASLETDVENLQAQLQAILGIRERSRANEEEDYFKKSCKLFAKSLDQRYYNSFFLDKEAYQEHIKDIITYRQLQYETVLSRPEEQMKYEQTNFSTPYNFIKLTKRTSTDQGISENTGDGRHLSLMSLEDSQSMARRSSDVPRYHNGSLVQPVASNVNPTQVSQDRAAQEAATTKSPSKLQKDKLWPIFIFEVKNRILLDSTVAILFDTLDATYDDDTKYAMQLNLYKILGRLFGMARTDFMSPIISNDLDVANLKPMLDKLNEYQTELLAEIDQHEVKTTIDQAEIEINDGHTFSQSKAAVESMMAGSNFCSYLEFFQDSEKDLIHFYGMEGLSKILLLFFNLYQRMNLVWTLFETLARKHESFDLLKQFNYFKDGMIQTLILQNHYDSMLDPEIFFKQLFGKCAPAIMNIPGLVSRRVLVVCADYNVRELLNIQAEADFTPKKGLNYLETKYFNFFFQLCSFDRKNKKLYIHNLQFEDESSSGVQQIQNDIKIPTGDL